MDDLIEVLAERSHIGWMKEKQAQGFADHARTVDASGHGCCTKELHHPDMLPYADLAESVKEYDRATVRGVLDGIAEAGYVIVTRDGLRQMGDAVALLNSMVLSGEDHSDRSRAAVEYAASIAGAVR